MDINVALRVTVLFPGISANCDIYRGQKSLLLLEKEVILLFKERSVWQGSSHFALSLNITLLFLVKKQHCFATSVSMLRLSFAGRNFLAFH